MSLPGRIGLLVCVALASACSDSTDSSRANATTGSWFEDAAQATGLEFVHQADASPDYRIPEIMGAGVALLDFDLDGDLDVYLLQGGDIPPVDAGRKAPADPGNRLFENRLVPTGQLEFTDVSQRAGAADTGYGMGVAVGDIDNDGDADIYLSNLGPNALLRNRGDGTFETVADAGGASDDTMTSSASFLDFDRDGDLDLFVARYIRFDADDLPVCFGPVGPDYCPPQRYQALPHSLYRNTGGGHFEEVSRELGIHEAAPGLGVTAADLDGDGWSDVYVANDRVANHFWVNRAGRNFDNEGLRAGNAYNAAGAAEASMGVVAGDVDADGDDDLFMTHYDPETNTLYRNDGNGVFVDVTDRFGLGIVSMSYTGWGTGWQDFDHDGDLDLLVVNGGVMKAERPAAIGADPYAQTNQLFENRDGRFYLRPAEPALALAENSRGLAFGDLDNDGDVDAVVTNNGGRARLLLNRGTRAGSAVQLMLVGSASPRDAQGSRAALLFTDDSALWRRVHTDGSYLSASDRRVHFGLAQGRQAAGVVVAWTSGVCEFFAAVRQPGSYRLVEGTGRSPTAADGQAQRALESMPCQGPESGGGSGDG